MSSGGRGWRRRGLKLDRTKIEKVELQTWTATVVYACLSLLRLDDPMQNPRKLLDELMPNDTKVWLLWKDIVSQALDVKTPGSTAFSDASLHDDLERKRRDLSNKDKDLLRTLLEDAEIARHAFYESSSSITGTVGV